MEKAVLYVVATPIGNLNDLSARAKQVLQQADWIAAEDTRHSAILLGHCQSQAKLMTVHQHNEAQVAHVVIERLLAGETVALISDAGTPAISDPGARVVAKARSANCQVIAIPGPCAMAAALSIAGFVDSCFSFIGFLPARAEQRKTVLNQWAKCNQALVFYEAPHRIEETIMALKEIFGTERPLLIARELTKCFEESIVCTLGQAPDWLNAEPKRKKGEFVLVLAPKPPAEDETIESMAYFAEMNRLLIELNKADLPVKQITAIVSKTFSMSKKQIYPLVLALRSSQAEIIDDETDIR